MPKILDNESMIFHSTHHFYLQINGLKYNTNSVITFKLSENRILKGNLESSHKQNNPQECKIPETQHKPPNKWQMT